MNTLNYSLKMPSELIIFLWSVPPDLVLLCSMKTTQWKVLYMLCKTVLKHNVYVVLQALSVHVKYSVLYLCKAVGLSSQE